MIKNEYIMKKKVICHNRIQIFEDTVKNHVIMLILGPQGGNRGDAHQVRPPHLRVRPRPPTLS